MPALVLDRAPLPTDASIRNFQQGKVGYVANVVEQALLLLEDMADLRSLRKYEVFLSLKRDLALAVQAAHRAEEIVISSHKAMKEEEGRSVVTVKALELAKKKSQDLNAKLVEVDRDKKRAETALDEVERQVKAQCKQLRQVEDKLSAARSQIKVLTKKLKEAEKAKEQDRYDVGVAEIEEALRAEVSEVYRFYHL
ncbi:tropomyosin alpha-3 chain-like [Quercus lobata]|uniref:tropomyosin alpha-3 chain-like n=1 Tax=Quercus lobata TaxID=97700 RepID=UPI0012482100|nr:tropomyosin alpha-3 chain-like [Quercus lobata]